MNDEGTEMGGLIYGGAKGQDGQIRSNGHLSFDQYDQDQMFSLDAGQEGPTKRTMLVISDGGDYPFHEAIDEIARIKSLSGQERETAMKKFLDASRRSSAPCAWAKRRIGPRSCACKIPKVVIELSWKWRRMECRI
jgi:hypothetical protein